MRVKQSIYDVFGTVSCDEVLKGRICEYMIEHMHRNRKPAPRRMKRMISLACLPLFVISGLGSCSLYYTEAAVISIDVSPSIKLGINRRGEVADQTAHGEESETILQSLSLKYLECEEALALLLANDAMQQYLEKGALISITLEIKDGDSQMSSDLQECVNTALVQYRGVKTEHADVGSHMCEKAHEHEMPPEKYYAVQKLLTVDPQAMLGEFRDKSIREIRAHMEHCEHWQQRICGELQGQSQVESQAESSQAESSQMESQEESSQAESQAELSQADFQGKSQADFQDKFPDNSLQPTERSHSQTDSQETGCYGSRHHGRRN